MRNLSFGLLLWLLALPSFGATGWFKDQTCSANSAIRDADLVLSGSAFFCADDTTVLNSFSKVLATQGWVLDLVRAGDQLQGGAGACVVEVYMPFKASGATVSATTGIPQLRGDADGNGIEDAAFALDGTVSKGALRGFLAPSLVFKVTTIPTAGQQCVIAVLGRR